MRGDLIETFKVLGNLTKYGSKLYRRSRSGMKLLYTNNKGKYTEHFLPNRVVNYWNKIPDIVKDSTSVDMFKIRLENFKKTHREAAGNIWELSDELYVKIENYDRSSYENYMVEHPDVAGRKGVDVSNSISKY